MSLYIYYLTAVLPYFSLELLLRTMLLCLPFIRFSFPPENLKSHRNSYKINAHYSLMWAVGELTMLW